MEKLNRHLPEGLRILECRMVPINAAHKTFKPADYTITLKNGCFNEEKINDFLDRKAFIFSRVNRKGKSKTIDLKKMIFNLALMSPDTLKMSLITEPGNTVRPVEVLDKIFGLPDQEIRLAKIVKS